MRWKTRKPFAKRRARHWWHDWFAWYPVRVPNTGKTVVWLELVQRKGRLSHRWAEGCWIWKYKEVGNE